jgi:hypothetical protein
MIDGVSFFLDQTVGEVNQKLYNRMLICDSDIVGRAMILSLPELRIIFHQSVAAAPKSS